MTISMPADGNVIVSEHVPGEYWTFSTLNAPGYGLKEIPGMGFILLNERMELDN
jgi:hypothetical protein